MTIELQLWEHMQLPLFELNKDGFPRPGKVSRHYRELKKQSNPAYTQQYLATLLGVTDQWIWEIEHHDRGMDSISLRRKLARNLNIPLVLFALSSFEDEPQLGKCIKSQRTTVKKDNPLRTQQGLARALGVTEKAVREMENYNKGLDSLTRRRMLANLLKLPPAVLGIVTLEELISQYQIAEAQSLQVGNTTKQTSIDIEEYQNALNRLWIQNHASTIQNELSMQELSARIVRISAILGYMGIDKEKIIRDILCRYLQLHAHIMRDQGRYDIAITELQQAVLQAEQVDNGLLLAATLLRLGGVFSDRGDVMLAMSRIDKATGDNAVAKHKESLAAVDHQETVRYYTRAFEITKLTPELQSAIMLGLGNAQARIAAGNKDKIEAAQKLINEGGKIIKQNQFENDEFAVKVNERRFYISKGASLIAAGWPKEALQVLSDAMNTSSQGDMTRMNAYHNLLWSQAYADTGSIEAAATLAQDTLAVMRDIKSNTNIARINGLYGQLSHLSSSNIEVIRLGVMLRG